MSETQKKEQPQVRFEARKLMEQVRLLCAEAQLLAEQFGTLTVQQNMRVRVSQVCVLLEPLKTALKIAGVPALPDKDQKQGESE
jgi:hypothetical protein